jgi:hypothetical protein
MMNKQKNSNLTFVQFLLKAQYLAQEETRSDKGYAMMMTSIISIAMLSMLAAYMTMTNLSKSSTNAYVDGTNTFYAAESGLNKRAQELREKFTEYATPAGTVPGSVTSGAITAANISNCFAISVNAPVAATNDFECRNYPFKYNNNIAAVKGESADIVLKEQDNNKNSVEYIAHTFVAPQQNYALNPPAPSTIPAGETYAGLRALEYRYTVYATATKPNTANAIKPNFDKDEIEAKAKITKTAADAALASSYDAKQAAADKANAIDAASSSSSNSVLQMDFKSRIVPLFQFAVFYDGDLEMNSSSNMTVGGRVHTNGNFYVRPNTGDAAVSTTFLSTITTVGSIYNRVDSTGLNGTASITRMLMTGATFTNFPGYGASTTDLTRGATDPLSTLELNVFNNRVRTGATGVTRLNTPPPGFLRKRNYYGSWTGNINTATNNSGEYYAKADMRLEMVPDRDVTSFAVSPWTRNRAIIPFNFTSMTSVAGAANTCTTTLPAKDPATGGVPTLANDPAANYIDPDRNNPGTTGTLLTNLHCNRFSKGQLQSLRQPVLVLTDLNQPNVALRTPLVTVPAGTTDPSEPAILGRPATLPAMPAGLSPTVMSLANITTRNTILRALQVALASTPSPVTLDILSKPFNDAAYTGAVGTPGRDFKDEFIRLLGTVPTTILPDADRTILIANTTTPNSIAALRNAWFLPAPIQRIEHNQAAVNIAPNARSSGFYDGRERRWMTMLQTNIASLSVWNRDGLYVNSTDAAGTLDDTLTTRYQTSVATRDAAFVAGTNSTNGLAFDRTPVAAIPATTTPRGLQTLGLGSINNTEGGLVLHATVSDDLNGDGVMSAANDVSLDVTNPIMKSNAVGALVGIDNQPVTATNPAVIVDYPRKYRNPAMSTAGAVLLPASPFAFAFNGGNYLPGALTLVTDQPIYVQGDFNNNGASQVPSPLTGANVPDPNRLPASIIGDVITVLSNQCLNRDAANGSTPTATNHLGVSMGQLNCGLPKFTTGSVNVTVGSLAGYYDVTAPTAVNAAFLSNTDRSNGNLGVGRNDTTRPARFSGALNNYMRMLERWNLTNISANAQFFNYTGSFVSLGTPLESNGAYFSGSSAIITPGAYYNIPQRNFNFDNNFDNFGTLPPLPPRAIYLQQEVFKRSNN